MILRAFPALFILGICAASGRADEFTDSLARLEKTTGGRIGVAVLNSADGQLRGYRQDERFAMASTFKVLLAGAVLARVDDGRERLDRMISYGEPDILSYAPVTKVHLTEGRLPVGDLCAATVEMSDNTAANLLLASLGGPQTITDFLRSLGDNKTRLDRNEPTLNSNLPGDERDTTTPAAMTATLRKLLLGDALSAGSRQQLTEWMIQCQTGAAKLRAGLPADWKIGDKTGSGKNGASNDVAIIWPLDRPPVFVAVYTSGLAGTPEEQSAVVADAGHIIAAGLSESR